ncbi:YbaN family protein [Rheinheimera sp. 1928-s]|uniref:YbaN family protein n=1 Tax=Rheinheimera sp. 1928-s TaxID=3033803 RepID=UPI002635BEE1|nr:YbaN family protein [Rheinheimera sp. 1928-s]MDF3125256.1 YbaN family protein [Rheinheimera sp. 1928-s]
MLKLLKVSCWRLLAGISLLLGLIGVVLPGLPTVPFLLVSAWSAGKGWPRLEIWLLEHPSFGPPLKRWREQGAVPRKAKYMALGMMSLSVVMLLLSPAPFLLKLLLPPFLCCVAIWLWRRPEA